MKMTKTKLRQSQSKNQKENFKEGVRIWTTFWRANPQRFVADYLQISLHVFQMILIYMMDKNAFFMFIASRGLGKSFIIAIYCCVRAILYPHSKIIVSAGSKSQAKLLISQKIEKELIGMSPNLRKEIKDIKCNGNEAKVIFKNGSTIEAVVSGDNSRGYRANVLIIDEFRLVDKDVVDRILRPFIGSSRTPPFVTLPKYIKYPREKNKEIYLSSAWFKSHWAWDKFKAFSNLMFKGKNTFVCDLPYTCAVEHGLLDQDRVDAIRSEEDMSEVSWLMEMCGVFYGENESAFYKSTEVNPCRTIEKPFYPPTEIEFLNAKGKKIKPSIKKQNGEIRIIGVDVALASGKRNDNSVYTLMRLFPNAGEFKREVVYIETHNGVSSEKQSIRLKQLFYDFETDYMIVDTQGIGVGVWGELQKIQYDNERDVEYPAFTCFNEDNTVDKLMNKGALPVVYSLKVTNAKMNHDIAMSLKDALITKKIRLLINDAEARDILVESQKDFLKKGGVEQAQLLKPFVQTTALVNELINLEYSINGGYIKVYETGTARKDRYSSLAYANFLADFLEKKEKKKQRQDTDEIFAIW